MGGGGLCHCVAEKTNGHPISAVQRQSEINCKQSPVQVKLVGVPYKLLTQCRQVVFKERFTVKCEKKQQLM